MDVLTFRDARARLGAVIGTPGVREVCMVSLDTEQPYA